MKHFPQPFPDDYRIGQDKVARIRLESAEAEMAQHYMSAFQLGWENPEWRAMSRRLFYQARAEYERAKKILETLS